MKFSFYKNNAEKNGRFQVQIMRKGGNKRARMIFDTCSKLSIGAQKQSHLFSIWTTFSNACGVLIANF